MNISLFIGNLPYDLNRDELLSLLARHGTIVSLEIVTDKFSLKSKGFAHAVAEDLQSGENIINKLNGEIIDGRPVKIEFFRK